MKLEKIDRKEIAILEPEISNALKPLNEKYGVSFRFDGGTIYEGYFDMKITVLLDGAKTLDQKMFDQQVKLHKLDTRKIWKIKGREFMLSGYRPKATKNCFIVTDIKTDKESVITLQTALSFFGTEVGKRNINLIKGTLTQTDRNGNAIGE
tara:strand:+ start:122 stop:574 length:453 start_codon:yes stop_codon:yes gene_type:complete